MAKCVECGLLGEQGPKGNVLEVSERVRSGKTRTGSDFRVSFPPLVCNAGEREFHEQPFGSGDDLVAAIEKDVPCEREVPYVPTQSPQDAEETSDERRKLQLQRQMHESAEKTSADRHKQSMSLRKCGIIIGAVLSVVLFIVKVIGDKLKWW